MTRFLGRLGHVTLGMACVLLGTVATARSAGPPAALSDGTRLDLFLLVGQSNMSGRGKVEPQDTVPNPRVWMLTKSDTWVPAVDPLHFDKPQVAGVGPGRTFGIAVAAAEPGVTVGLVPCAVGGTSIEQWRKGGKLYADAVARAKVAMDRGTFKAILWHQGESDANPAKHAGYPDKLRTLIADFRHDLGLPDVPFIVGQLGPFHEKTSPGTDAFNTQLAAFAAAEPHCACVSSDGLTSIGDNTHFDAPSQREFGRRYAAAYLKLVGNAATPVR
jgi:hypothetical protein